MNVTTRSSTPGRLLPRWRRSGAMQASAFYEKSDLCQEHEPRGKAERQLDLPKNNTKTEPQRDMFVRQYANRHSQMNKCSSLGWMVNPLTLGTVHQRFSFAVVDFKRGLQGAHRHLHDSLRWYLLLSLPMRLFFQFVFKVQYISTHYKKT